MTCPGHAVRPNAGKALSRKGWDLPQHRFTRRQEILEGGFEVAGVPWIGYVATDAGIGHHEVNLSLRVVGDDAPDEPQVGGVHADDAVEAVIIGLGNLAGAFVGIEPHAVLAQAAPGRRINGVADLLRGDRCRLNMELAVPPLSFHQGLEDELCHSAPADISMTDEQDSHLAKVSANILQGN